ncbi:MAG: hypothetical protein WCZ87_00290 [Thiohalobacteraceae bacterium]
MGAALVREAGGSLDDFINRIRDAWWRQNSSDDGVPVPWVVDVFPDRIIVKRNEADAQRYYQVDMSATDEAVTFAGPDEWQEVKLDYVASADTAPDAPVAEAAAESLRFDVSLPVREVRTTDDGAIDGVIVVEGRSANGNVYTREALQSGVRIFDGALMFADHPSAVEEAQRPERSVRDVVGRVKGPYIGTTKDGKTALRGKFHVSEAETSLRTKIAEGIIDGLSLRAFGQGKRDKSGDFIVESFQANPFTSVDVVTVAAAGGGFERLAESDRAALTRAVLQQVTREDLAATRPDLVEAQPEVRALQEADVGDTQKLEEAQADNQRLIEENTRLFREARSAEARTIVEGVLGQAQTLPDAARERITGQVAGLTEAYSTHGSTQTADELKDAVEGVVEAERAYIAKLVPNGAVSGGTARPDLSEAPNEGALDEQLNAVIASMR